MPSNDQFIKIIESLSDARMKKYIRRNTDLATSLRAYEWGLSLDQALIKPLNITEVALRNAIDRALCAWWRSEGHAGSWTDIRADGFEPVLDALVHRKDWRGRAQQNVVGRTVTHDDIIANTSFGTWRNLIGNPSSIRSVPPADRKRYRSWLALKDRDAKCALLWKTVLKDAFPNLPRTKRLRGKQSPRGYVGSRVARIAALRNRTCHWDSLLNAQVPRRYRDMWELLNAIDPVLSSWLDDLCDWELANVLLERPVWL